MVTPSDSANAPRPLVEYPAELPVAARREEIVRALRDHHTLILAGETGSGKTTQLPKMLVEAGFAYTGRIAVTQPRRVAALAVSRRIAEELRTEWGGFVGCQIRFNDRSRDETRIKVMTDGILLNEIQHDPLLRRYSAVMLDEAHERSLNMDFLIGHFRKIRAKRPDLRLVITSATLDLDAFSQAFPDAPIIRVSGRTYPVEVVWRPLDRLREESGDISHTEAAAQTARDIAAAGGRGDILVFMPTERDIRETCALLEKHGPKPAEILPLFGRLSAADQQRIFAPSPRRKIIVATNVAETSLTIPGIRYVIDSGLARVSRHNPQTRTRRLPVEPVSRSAANQRKGRCGRVAEGVCFRLYSEEDFEKRPEQTEPEILRSNLAGVILRMLAFRLGDIREFPFLNPPQERAVRAGFAQLHELGAIDETHAITPLGREMARLPVDPTIARMLLQARREHCLREVLVIAAALSIMDPRERPQENPGRADTMHKPFLDPQSDFLTLLNIWDAYHDQCENLSTGKLRRFCREHFLNFLRMQEWRDLHQQLERAVEELGEREPRRDEPPATADAARVSRAGYDPIHRSILAGLLGNIAKLDKDGDYVATHTRKTALFPGSSLAKAKRESDIARLRRKPGDPAPERPAKQPDWIMCAAWMETSRLFALTAAKISPDWILRLGSHLLHVSHTEPFWDESGCRAAIRERTRLHGLEIASRAVSLTPFDPEAATAMFIANALVPDALAENFEFAEHNREILRTVEERLMRLRKFSAGAVDDSLAAFYASRLSAVGNCGDLRRFCRDNRVAETRILHLKESDIDDTPDLDSEKFPAFVTVAGRAFPLEYRQDPGGEQDGVTVRLPAELYPSLPPGFLDRLVPGYLPERIELLLRRLPKAIRITLFPIAEKVERLLAEAKPDPTLRLEDWLAREAYARWKVIFSPADLAGAEIPERLLPRLVLIEPDTGSHLGGGRDFGTLRDVWDAARLATKSAPPPASAPPKPGAKPTPPASADPIEALRRRHERDNLTAWTFDDPPESLAAGDAAGVPILVHPGLLADGKAAHLRLFRSRAEAEEATLAGLLALGEHALKSELSGLDYALAKDLKALHLLWLPLGSGDRLLAGSKGILRRHLLHTAPPLPLSARVWEERVKGARAAAPGLAAAYLKTLRAILEQRDSLRGAGDTAYPGAAADMAALIPPDFLDTAAYAEFPRLLRWLRGRNLRRERHRHGAAKDAEKAAKVKPYELRFAEFSKLRAVTPEQRAALKEFRRLLEEFRIAVFAPEVGTEGKISPAILDAFCAELNRHFGRK